MNKLTTSLLASTIVLFFTGCATTTNKSLSSAPLEVVLSSKMNADIDVDMSKKISGTAVLKKVLIFTTTEPEYFADGVTYSVGGTSAAPGLFSFLGGSPVDSVKSAAAFNALSAAKAEILVAPTYVVKNNKTLFTHEITVQVTGYAGKLKAIKPISSPTL